MPAAYAHHTFGDTCIENMPEKIKKICMQNREVFDFGVHGPDVLFYYNPLNSNEVNRYGSELHHWTGKQFFEHTKQVFKSGKIANRAAFLAYVFGFLAHYTLDSSCHGYINERAANTELSHNLIESQYEAYLMRMDGKNPLNVNRSKTLHPSPNRAETMADLFPFDGKVLLKSMKGQKKTLHLFYSPKEKKKKIIRSAISRFNIKGDFGGLFIDEIIVPECEEMNQKIYHMQKKAAKIYPALLQNLARYLFDKGVLDVYFEYDFEGELHEIGR